MRCWFLGIFLVPVLSLAQVSEENSGEKGFEQRDMRGEIEKPWRVPNGPTPYQWKSDRRWMSEAPSTKIALKRAESYLGGMSYPMWEVGERFELMYQAVEDRNIHYARHQLQTIARLMLYGSMARPRFKPYADAMFLDSQFHNMASAFDSGEYDKIYSELEATRQSCMGCHIATKFAYLNKIRLFEKLSPQNISRHKKVTFHSEWTQPEDAVAKVLKGKGYETTTVEGNLPERLEALLEKPLDDRKGDLVHITSVDFSLVKNGKGPKWHSYSKKSEDLKFVANTLKWGYGMLTLDPSITDSESLKGKRVGVVSRPSTLRLFAEAALKDKWNLVEGDVELISSSFSGLPKLLRDKTVDAIYLPIVDLRRDSYRVMFPDLFEKESVYWVPLPQQNKGSYSANFPMPTSILPKDSVAGIVNTPRKSIQVLTLQSALFAWSSTPDHIVRDTLVTMGEDSAAWKKLPNVGMRDFYFKDGQPLNVNSMSEFPGLSLMDVHPEAAKFYSSQ
ncbi:hypothetical protein [uncultured Pseudoteredinibacter sp.]|uniref:hypothetical protein n=1 Tax=uncultured Pseudoteredinibacter sp. TaxID=1641701 RepID=UPI0026326144|nr:hypothetical protein [uncultured Pseudoteredinibacter sp.]